MRNLVSKANKVRETRVLDSASLTKSANSVRRFARNDSQSLHRFVKRGFCQRITQHLQEWRNGKANDHFRLIQVVAVLARGGFFVQPREELLHEQFAGLIHEALADAGQGAAGLGVAGHVDGGLARFLFG